jgi:hypothetical protein
MIVPERRENTVVLVMKSMTKRIQKHPTLEIEYRQ